MIKLLRSFHYIDESGKDQGLNGEHNTQPTLAASSPKSPPQFATAPRN